MIEETFLKYVCIVGKLYYESVDEYNQIWFHCTNCDKKYKHSRSVCRHRKYECDQRPQFECQHCGKKIRQKSNFKSHLATIHNVIYDEIN